MPNVSDAYGPVIAAVLSSKRPRADTAEAAMAQVVGGSTPTEAESRYFEAFRVFRSTAAAVIWLRPKPNPTRTLTPQ